MNEEINNGEAVEHLEAIEEELKELNDNTIGPRHAFFNGIMQGMGVVGGSILAVALLGWTLHLLGLIPGLSEVGAYIEDLADKARD